MYTQKTIHFIGIAGSAVAPLAVMMAQKGWKVTGYEHNKVWEPMRSVLRNAGIKYSEQECKLVNVQNADLVIIGGSVLLRDIKNPEYIEAIRLGKKLVSYPYLIGKYITRKNSVVITGSYAKTTTTWILAWILEQSGMAPSFMGGGQPLNFEVGVHAVDGDYSVVEGDEFPAAWGHDMEPKFMYYKPTHVILTSAEWDHVDVFKTERDYIEAFLKLARLVKKDDGIMLINKAGKNNQAVIKEFGKDTITYDLNDDTADYTCKNIRFEGDMTKFDVLKDSVFLSSFETKIFGQHNVENILAAIAMADILGVVTDQTQEAISTFEGVKRRLEVVGQSSEGALIIDDFAHSPVKAKAACNAVRQKYPGKRIVGVFNVRMALNENRETLTWYPGVFDNIDEVIIPRVPVKKSIPKEERIYGKDIVAAISKTQPNVKYMPSTDALTEYLLETAKDGTVILLMSAGGWGGLIENLTV